MSFSEQIATIFIAGAATVAVRFLPFLLFSGKKIPKAIEYLGHVLPGAVFGMLVVYCLKDVTFLSYPFGVGEIVSSLMVVFLYKWKKNTLLAIGGGTVFYMFIVQVVL